MKNPLNDLEFLRQLDLTKDKATYAKIILLTKEEIPVQEIQGKITSGSISIDGTSAIRRTCSLTINASDIDVNNTYWALKNKFKLEIGVENTINPSYPDIIWFKQGVYIFTSLNMNVQSNNFTISINGKDKGCLINGEFGGTINSSTDFGQQEEYQTLQSGEIIRNITQVPIVNIIKNIMHIFAGEPLHNILINDVDEYGLELLEYRGDAPMYMLRQVDTGEVTNITVDGKKSYYLESGTVIYLDNDFNTGKDKIIYYDRTEKTNDATKVFTTPNASGEAYNIIQIEYGDTAGYRKTDLTYPGQLVANVGESLTSVLDKIKNMFSDFEYFYDVDGKFIFQKKKTYVNNSWNNLSTSEKDIYASDAAYTSSTSYTFENGVLLTAFTDAPAIANVKNDFSIWGTRQSVSGSSIVVHMRYAIDLKPKYYFPIRFEYKEITNWDKKSYQANKYYIRKEGKYVLAAETERLKDVVYYEETDIQIIDERTNQSFSGDNVVAFDSSKNECDWRELIYQMALDYFKYSHKKENFTKLIANANPDDYPTGITGYETYYTDMQGFWRQLYNPAAIGQAGNEKGYVELDITNDVGTGLFSTKTGWNYDVTHSPELLNFWFDFMSAEGEAGKYAVQAIGNRPKAIKDDKVKAIYFEQTPTTLFLTQQELNEMHNNPDLYLDMAGYTFIQLTPQMENYFTISAQGKSAQDELNNLLYQHIYATESVNLTALPIYHLTPNTRVLVKDNNTGIHGEYIVSKITIPLQYNGTTSITTTKAVERIY